MASKKVEITVTDQAGKKTTIKSKGLTKLFNNKDNFGKLYEVSFKEPSKSDTTAIVGNYLCQGKDTPPPVDTAPIVDAGEDVEVVPGVNVILDGSAKDMNGEIIRCGWIAPDDIKPLLVQDENDITNMSFVAPELPEGVDVRALIFTFEAEDNTHHISTDQTMVTIRRVPLPPDHQCGPDEHWDGTQCVKNTPPPTDGVLFNSLRDTKLHDGKVRTVTHEGDLSPGGLGVECRASGNPKIQVNEDNTFSLIGEPGYPRFYTYVKNYNARVETTAAWWTKIIDNQSHKGRSRHNEGGACDNRFGGYGFAVAEGDYDAKREVCHNTHDESHSGPIPKKIQLKQYFKTIFTIKDEGSKVRQIGAIDYLDGSGPKEVMNIVDSNPDPYMVNKTLYEAQSYIWHRLNKSGGEIRIKEINVVQV